MLRKLHKKCAVPPKLRRAFKSIWREGNRVLRKLVEARQQVPSCEIPVRDTAFRALLACCTVGLMELQVLHTFLFILCNMQLSCIKGIFIVWFERYTLHAMHLNFCLLVNILERIPENHSPNLVLQTAEESIFQIRLWLPHIQHGTRGGGFCELTAEDYKDSKVLYKTWLMPLGCFLETLKPRKEAD